VLKKIQAQAHERAALVEERARAVRSSPATPSSSSKPREAIERSWQTLAAEKVEQKSDGATGGNWQVAGQEERELGNGGLRRYILFVDELRTPMRPDVAPAETDCEIFAGNLPVTEYTPSQLRKWLEHYGAIADICLLTENETGEHSGYAYIRFQHHADAAKFIEKHVESITANWSESERLLKGQDGVYRSDVDASFDQIVGTADAKDLWMLSEKRRAGDNWSPRSQFKQLHFSVMCSAEQFKSLRSLLVSALAAFHEEAAAGLDTPDEKPGALDDRLKASVAKVPQVLSLEVIEDQMQKIRQVLACFAHGQPNLADFEELYEGFSNNLQFFYEALTRYGNAHQLAPALGTKINAFWEEVSSLREKIDSLTPASEPFNADSFTSGIGSQQLSAGRAEADITASATSTATASWTTTTATATSASTTRTTTLQAPSGAGVGKGVSQWRGATLGRFGKGGGSASQGRGGPSWYNWWPDPAGWAPTAWGPAGKGYHPAAGVAPQWGPNQGMGSPSQWDVAPASGSARFVRPPSRGY